MSGQDVIEIDLPFPDRQMLVGVAVIVMDVHVGET